MELGDCFRTNYGAHLCIVVSDPEFDDQNVLIVNITTLRVGKFHDSSCVLDVGDHPFIKHESYVAFQYAKRKSNNELDRLLANGSIILEGEKISNKTLDRIHAGAALSEYAPLEFQELLRIQGFIE